MEYKNSLNESHFKQHDNKGKGSFIDQPNVFDKKKMFNRNVTTKVMGIEVLDNRMLHSKSPINIVKNDLVENKISKILPTLSTKIFKLHQLYVPQSKNSLDNYDNSTILVKDDIEVLGTADIETVLNDMKQREIQMIIDHEPFLTNPITKAVTESSFVPEPLFKQSYIVPGYEFSTFSFVNCPNNTLTIIDELIENKRQVHDIYDRSLKEDSYTIACNIENELQKKLKKTYKKIKNKLSKDYNKEIKQAKSSVKERISKINKSVPKKVCSLPSKSKTKLKTKMLSNKATKLNNKTTKCMESSLHKNKLTTSSPKIQTPVDEFGQGSEFEQLLAKFQANGIMDNVMLTTHNMVGKKYLKKNSKRGVKIDSIQENKHSYHSDKEMSNILEYADVDKVDLGNVTAINEATAESTTATDESYEGLSNKISYNDYVNGYKYYLNFQKSNDDDKFSNLVRYQAHKHHNVDDIGKFILKKIPQLPTTRLRRYFVESETLEDQDISTKSEDSWFKRHFFVFLDSNSPKKFHTSETVSLKAPDLVTTKKSVKAMNACKHKPTDLRTTTTATTRRNKRNLISSKRKNWGKDSASKSSMRGKDGVVSSNIVQNAYDTEKEEMLSESQPMPKILTQNIRSENSYHGKHTSGKKNGFVSIDLVHRSTGLVKSNKSMKQKSKLRNFFRKFKINNSKPKVIQKRQNSNRAHRFNIFEGFKNIFKVKPNSRRTNELKVFDYEKVIPRNTPESFDSNFKLFNVEDIRKQIPNITGDFNYPYNFLQPVTNDDLEIYYNLKPELEMKTKSLSLLSGKQFQYSNEKNDVIDVNVKSDESNLPNFTVNMKDIHSATLPTGEESFFHNTINERHVFGKLTQKSFKQNKDKTNEENGLIKKWVPSNKVQKINSKPYPFSISMTMKGKNTSGNCDQTSKIVDIAEKKAVQYNDFNYIKGNRNKGIINTNHTKPSISSITRITAPPKQYFTTVLPMQNNEFDKFLKDNQIDVESVTSPLLNTSRSLITKYPKKVVGEASDRKMKIQGNVNGHSANNYLPKAKLKVQKDYFSLNDNVYDRDLQLYLSLPNKNRDPLRFSHIRTEENFVNTATKKPRRLKISGHSYKYDIIYHKKYDDNADESIHWSKKEIMRPQNKKVYFKPMLEIKSKKPGIKELKFGKRSAQEESFTAKDVAALEVVVDLFKNTPACDGRHGSLNAFVDNHSPSSEHSLLQSSLADTHATNSIQVHIAFPCNKEDKKRALEPLRLRKVFSAIMSTPVDLEYQIHSFEETTIAPTATVQNILTPGLYLLVENTNITCPEGKFVLKPVKTTPSKLAMRHIKDNKDMISSTSSVHVERVSLNKEFVDALNEEKHSNDKSAHNITNGKIKRSLSVQMKKNGIHDSNTVQHFHDTSKRQYPVENINSLNNIKVNLICKKDFTKPAIVSRDTVHKNFLDKNINAGVYCDDEEMKKSKTNWKSIRNFLKECSIKKKSRTKNQYITIKRNLRSINKVTRPLQTTKNY